MISIRVSADDLMQTRFAFSPLWEVVASYRVLVDPARHAVHLPWVRKAYEDLRGLDLGPLDALVRAQGYIPDFLTPPPATPFPDFFDEVERLRGTGAERIREESGRLSIYGPDHARSLGSYMEDPRGRSGPAPARSPSTWPD